MAGGLPMGAAMLHARWGALPPAVHGSTFGGNPLACAAALATLQFILDNNLPQQAEVKGQLFRERLCAIRSPLVREVRGIGLMNGIELKQKVAPYLSELMSVGVLALPAGLTVIRFLPPLVISSEEIIQTVDAVEKVLKGSETQ
jgi:LysW-gamma-L-lysine/LysW-L-ornithine aminotransferase